MFVTYLYVDDVSLGTVIRNESELLLDLIGLGHEDGRSLTVSSREVSVRLGIRLEERDWGKEKQR